MIFRSNIPLRIEIILIMIFKLSFLAALWFICFSHPVQPTLNASLIYQHLITSNNSTGGQHLDS